MASTKDVLDHHLKSFSEGDLAGILSDYAPGAVLFTRDDRSGAGAIRPLFQALIAGSGNLAQVQPAAAVGQLHTFCGPRTADNVYEVATDTSSCRTARSRPTGRSCPRFA
jgi:hypothetical protein